MSSTVKRMSARLKAAKWGSTTGEHRGYYLCIKVGGVEVKRFIGVSFEEAQSNLEKACDLWLTEKNGWQWGIEYSHGLSQNGYVAWGNLDLSDQFI